MDPNELVPDASTLCSASQQHPVAKAASGDEWQCEPQGKKPYDSVPT
jgi:hypothetical protein